MGKLSFEEIKDFDRILLPLFRDYFAKGFFSQREAEKFLREHAEPRLGDYVLIKEIPCHLSKIITPSHAYYICKTFKGKSYMFLDNDFGHWIENHSLVICPREEVAKRFQYRSDFSIE